MLVITCGYGSLAQTDNLPQMGEPVDQSLSPQEERRIGAQFMRQAIESLPIITDYQAQEYIQRLGERLLAGLTGTEYPYTFFLLEDDSINAFAVPGGYIAINSGLIRAFGSESQLAAVMAHEIAHVSQRHHARAYSAQGHSGLTTAAAILAAIIVGQNSAEAGQAALATGLAVSQQTQINYTRANEYEADRIGIDILSKAGFSASGMVESFDILKRNSSLNASAYQLEYLRTHPLGDNRIAEARNRTAMIGDQGDHDSLSYQLFRTRLAVLTSVDQANLRQVFIKARNAEDNPSVQYGLALLEERSGDFNSAKTRTSTLLAKHGHNFFIRILDAKLDFLTGRQEDGVQALQDIIEVYPGDYSPVELLADLLMSADQADEAYDTLVRYTRRVTPANTNAYRQLANVEQKRHNLTASHEYLASYYEKNQQSGEAIRQLEMALNTAGEDSIARLRIQARLKQIQK
ncbi:MAG: M48 family metallopeptidase [Gammaproteobacteria bacterium]|nr:M48 family metallopeptidase [Gammaproteobacteria bacterium]